MTDTLVHQAADVEILRLKAYYQAHVVAASKTDAQDITRVVALRKAAHAMLETGQMPVESLHTAGAFIFEFSKMHEYSAEELIVNVSSFLHVMRIICEGPTKSFFLICSNNLRKNPELIQAVLTNLANAIMCTVKMQNEVGIHTEVVNRYRSLRPNAYRVVMAKEHNFDKPLENLLDVWMKYKDIVLKADKGRWKDMVCGAVTGAEKYGYKPHDVSLLLL